MRCLINAHLTDNTRTVVNVPSFYVYRTPDTQTPTSRCVLIRFESTQCCPLFIPLTPSVVIDLHVAKKTCTVVSCLRCEGVYIHVQCSIYIYHVCDLICLFLSLTGNITRWVISNACLGSLVVSPCFIFVFVHFFSSHLLFHFCYSLKHCSSFPLICLWNKFTVKYMNCIKACLGWNDLFEVKFLYHFSKICIVPLFCYAHGPPNKYQQLL